MLCGTLPFVLMYRLLCCFQVTPFQRAQFLFARRMLTGRRVVCNAQQLVSYPRHCRDNHNGKGLSRLSAMPRNNMSYAANTFAAADRGSSKLKDTDTTLHGITPVRLLLWRRKRTSTIFTYFLDIYICRFA